MPSSQGIKLNVTPNDWDEMHKQLNWVIKDIYALFDTVRGLDGKVSDVKLDNLSPPDDTTDLNATTSAHGLLPKLSGIATNVLSGIGRWIPGGNVVGPATAAASNLSEFDGISGVVIKDGGLSHAGTADAISKKHVAVTLGTANGLSLSTQALSLLAATASTPGAATAAQITKLDGIRTGVRVAVSDADRLNTVLTTDSLVAFTALSAPRSYQISSEDIADASATNPRVFTIKDESGDASAHAITISTEGTEKIDGADTASISVNYGSVTIYSNGSNLFTI